MSSAAAALTHRPRRRGPRTAGRSVLNGSTLHAGAGVQLLGPRRGRHLLGHPVGAPVAVVDGVGQQPAVLVEQAVVDGPRVDARCRRSRRRRVRRPATRRARPPTTRARPSAACRPAAPAGSRSGAPRAARPAAATPRPASRGPRTPRGRRPRTTAHRRNAAATPASTGMCRPVVWARSPPVRANTAFGDVLGQHLALEQRALGVERAEVFLGHAVHRGALRAPTAGEDAGPAHHAVGVHAVDPDPVPPSSAASSRT